METTTLKHTPLHQIHHQLGGKLIPFAGWEMPVEYSGIMEEHRAVRDKVGIFDLTHMGELEITGPEALGMIQALVTNDVSSLEINQICYTVVCREDGGILDDILVYRLADRIFCVVNASNTAKIRDWFSAHTPPGARLRDLTDQTVLIAVQGPLTQSILQPMVDVDLESIGYYRVRENVTLAGRRILLSRTGYTGEDGFEIYCPPDDAQYHWENLYQAGTPAGMVPVGLGARDTLRLEAGYCLYGNEIDENTNPLDARLGWVVKLNRGDFIGREALLRIKEAGSARRLVGFQMDDRSVPRHGYPLALEGRTLGTVTSGTFSPTLGKGIGLGYLPAAHCGEGNPIEVIIRERPHPATLVKTPFHRGGVRR